MSQPDLSIVIPVYNRGDVIRYTLESIQRARAGLSVEVIVVDDGSQVPAADSIRTLGYSPEQIIRQENRGLLFARLAGLAAVTGRHTLFLDSDDLVSTAKLRLQIEALDRTNADVSYTDTARITLDGDFDELAVFPDSPAAATDDGQEFFLLIQPAPHSPVFRTEFLRQVVAEAAFPPSPLYNAVAEIWFYHNAALRRSAAVKVDGPHTLVGQHPGARLTNHWEKLGVASLAVQEAFARSCPATADGRRARTLAALKAFGAWRRLPYGFNAEFDRRLLDVYRRAPQHPAVNALGGGLFRKLAAVLGPVNAGRLLRRLRGSPYAGCRTVDDATLADWLNQLPPP